jgi:hypothetical protein
MKPITAKMAYDYADKEIEELDIGLTLIQERAIRLCLVSAYLEGTKDQLNKMIKELKR